MSTGSAGKAALSAALELPDRLAEQIDRLGEGRVTVAHNSVSRYVWFSDRRVLALTSSVEAEKLGGWLVSRGLADRAVIREALAGKASEERLGRALVRLGVLDHHCLLEELEVLAFALAARVLAEGGTLGGEPGLRVPQDARIIDTDPSTLFIDAVMRTPEIDSLADLVGHGRVWEAQSGVDLQAYPLTDSQRYMLTLLRPPKTLDALRRVVFQDYDDVVRDLTALAVAGLAAVRGGDRPAAPRGSRTPSHDARQVIGSPPPLLVQPTLLRPARSGPDPRLRATLKELEAEAAESAATGGMVGADGVLAGADLRRAERLLAAAEQQLADGDRRGALRALTYAVEVVPCASLFSRLAELELEDPRLQPAGLDHLRRAVGFAPHFTDAWLALATYWREREQADKERRCLEKILVYEPEHAEARQRLAEL